MLCIDVQIKPSWLSFYKDICWTSAPATWIVKHFFQKMFQPMLCLDSIRLDLTWVDFQNPNDNFCCLFRLSIAYKFHSKFLRAKGFATKAFEKVTQSFEGGERRWLLRRISESRLEREELCIRYGIPIRFESVSDLGDKKAEPTILLVHLSKLL